MMTIYYNTLLNLKCFHNIPSIIVYTTKFFTVIVCAVPFPPYHVNRTEVYTMAVMVAVMELGC
jgi:hypothetical protein